MPRASVWSWVILSSISASLAVARWRSALVLGCWKETTSSSSTSSKVNPRRWAFLIVWIVATAVFGYSRCLDGRRWGWRGARGVRSGAASGG